MKVKACLRDNARNTRLYVFLMYNQIIDGLLKQPQVRLVFQPRPDRGAIEYAVGLCPGRTYRGAFAGVERAKLNAGFVGCHRHRPAERIDFLDQMPLANTADRWIAGHLA